MVGIDPHGVLEGSQGPIGLPLGAARQAKVVPGVHQVRPELDRPLEAQPRLRHPALVQESQAEIVVRLGQVGLEVQRLLETEPRLLQSAQGHQGQPHVRVRPDAVRPEPQGLLVAGDCRF